MIASRHTRVILALFMLGGALLTPLEIAHAFGAGGNNVPNAESGEIFSKETWKDLAAWIAGTALQREIQDSIISFVSTGSKSGEPLFVQNLATHMQRLGDSTAIPFIETFSAQSNSPFAPAISSSLFRQYRQNTSLDGFFASKQCTLYDVSPNVDGFLAGDFTQGGVAAWLSLTTKEENNPYLLYQDSQGALANVVATAKTNRQQELQWGSGFLSECDAEKPSAGWDICTGANGGSGSAATPGTVFKSEIEEAVGSDMKRILQADELSEVIGGFIMSLIFDQGIFDSFTGGSDGNSRPIDNYYADSNPYITPGADVLFANILEFLDSAEVAIQEWRANWQALGTQAALSLQQVSALIQEAQAYAGALNSACWTRDKGTLIADAQAAQTNILTPTLNDAQAAFRNADIASTSIATVRALAASTSPAAREDAITAADSLDSLPPSDSDLAYAARESERSENGATATPAGSLSTLSGGTLLDRLILISQNADRSRAVCFQAESVDEGSGDDAAAQEESAQIAEACEADGGTLYYIPSTGNQANQNLREDINDPNACLAQTVGSANPSLFNPGQLSCAASGAQCPPGTQPYSTGGVNYCYYANCPYDDGGISSESSSSQFSGFCSSSGGTVYSCQPIGVVTRCTYSSGGASYSLTCPGDPSSCYDADALSIPLSCGSYVGGVFQCPAGTADYYGTCIPTVP